MGIMGDMDVGDVSVTSTMEEGKPSVAEASNFLRILGDLLF